MTNIIRRWLSRFLTVNHYRVHKTDLEKIRAEKHRQLAAELGRDWDYG